jgi:hypothetical protein
MKWFAKKRSQPVLGLSLEGGQLRAAQVGRTKGAVTVGKTVSAALSLDLSHHEVELIGREIRNHLDAAGLRERHCVVVVPAGWIMSQHTKLPELSPEDTAGFLQMEAERGFPCAPDQLQIARSFHRSADIAYVTQLAVRKEQLERLVAVLKAAGLKPLSLSLGLAALPGALAPAGQGRITVAVDAKGATLLVSSGGGIAAFRTCEATIESEAGDRLINTGAVARELRITLEQTPADLRQELRRLDLIGDEAVVRQLEESLADWARSAGLELQSHGSPEGRSADLMVENLAACWLEAGASFLEFLPPRVGRWAQLVARYNAKRLATVGMAVGAVAVLALAVFGWQQIHCWSLRSEWAGMKPQVTALNAVQDRIREFRPWYDTSYRNLSILRRVTEAFPDNGSVTARTFEVHGLTTVNVSVTGVTRDNAALLKTVDQLRKIREIADVKVEQIRGKSPAQFTFSFRWNGNFGL